MHLRHPALDAVRSKAVVLLLLILCFCCSHCLCVGGLLARSLFCYAVLLTSLQTS